MENLKKIYTKVLAKKWINSISKWAYSLEIIKKFLYEKLNTKNIKVRWKLKNNILFVNITPSILSTELFINKKQVLEQLNWKLKSLWYTAIKDIIKK